MSIEVILLALALMLIFEGLGPALFPNQWQKYLQELSQLPKSQLRAIGIVLIILGWLLFMWFKP